MVRQVRVILVDIAMAQTVAINGSALSVSRKIYRVPGVDVFSSLLPSIAHQGFSSVHSRRVAPQYCRAAALRRLDRVRRTLSVL